MLEITSCKECRSPKRRKPNGKIVCDLCKRMESANYRKRNADSIKIYNKKCYDQNKEKESLRKKKWRLENPEKARLRYHPLKNRYNHMIDRCFNSESLPFKNYGGRGITVCDRWLGKEGFDRYVEDVYSTYIPGLTLDRINNNGNYEPNNVRWVDKLVQNNNTRAKLEYKLSIPDNSPIYLSFNKLGTIKQFSEINDIPLIVVKYRYAQHVNEEWILNCNTDNRYYEYLGHMYNMMELTLLSNLRYDVIRSRIRKYGWTVSEAIETPSTSQVKPELPRG